jgi:hypothetical protein
LEYCLRLRILFLATSAELEAVIIDQLDPFEHEPAFISQATAFLKNTGFIVDLYLLLTYWLN